MMNRMKAMICALTVSAAMAAAPAVVSARDNQSVYTWDTYTLVLWDQVGNDSALTGIVPDASGLELHVQYDLNG